MWEESGPGTMHRDGEGASLVALGTDAWRWAGTWTLAPGRAQWMGSPREQRPSASPIAHCSREAEPQRHRLTGEDREGRVLGKRAGGQGQQVTSGCGWGCCALWTGVGGRAVERLVQWV